MPCTRPSSVPRIRSNDCPGWRCTPSCSAASISQSWAGISGLLSRQARWTSLPNRIAVRAQSIATFPPPRTCIRFPSGGASVSLPFWYFPKRTSLKNRVLMITPSKFDPGMGRRMPSWAPTAMRTALKPLANNSSRLSTL